MYALCCHPADIILLMSGLCVWRRGLLRPRLTMLITMTKEWGQLHDVYAQLDDQRVLLAK